ncbi:MAG TPA: hypothetical protein VFD46_10300 [Chryseolinea sp.]|nr:hypothetical protein [Chryseolinea sp.]
MKRWTTIVLMFISVAGVCIDENDDKRLDVFLCKVEKFNKKKELATTNWRMPNVNPEASMDNMATANLSFFDHESGLEYTPATGKVFDSELKIELDLATGIVYDYKTKKEYLLSDLQKQRSQE